MKTNAKACLAATCAGNPISNPVLRRSLVIMLMFCWGPACRLPAQITCVNCPANGQAASASISIFLTRTNGTIILPGNPIGAFEPIVVHTELGYKAAFPGGVVGAGYYGGAARVIAFPGDGDIPESTNDVATAELASTKIGPVSPAPNACGDTDSLPLRNFIYVPTAADVAAGSVKFRFEYSGGIVLIVPCNLRVSATSEAWVQVAAPPTSSIAPSAVSVQSGGTVSLNVNATGTSPFSYCWRKGSGNGDCLSTNSSFTLANVQSSDTGEYTATVTDAFGCAASGSARVHLIPQISSMSVEGTNITLTGTGGDANAVLMLLTAPEPSTPAEFWIPISTNNNFDAKGQFIFTTTIDRSEKKRFFRLQLL